MFIRQARIVGSAGEPVDILIDGAQVREVLAGIREHSVQIVEGDGRWVLPGLWDKHVHLGQWASARRSIDLQQTRSAGDVLALVRDALAGGPRGRRRALVGSGYRIAGWSDRASVAALDEVAGEYPVVLISGDSHNAWLSSAALRLAGLPPREDVIAEREWFDSYPAITQALGLLPSTDDYADAIRDAHRLGVVGLVDLQFEAGFGQWPQRAETLPPMRVRTGVYPDDLHTALSRGLRTGQPLGGLVEMGPLKVLVDGALGTRTAYCRAPYADGAGGTGVLSYGRTELTELARAAVAGGIEVALHAIGDAALELVLDVIEQTGARGSIEHAQLTEPSDLQRMSRLGIIASVQPAHLLDDRDLADVCWAGRTDRAFALRSMIEAGVPLALGSDAPVAPLDPWLAIDAAVRRCADGDEPWHPEEAITRAQALSASVDGRRIAPGEPADLVLLDDDPLAVRRPTVSATFIAGQQVY